MYGCGSGSCSHRLLACLFVYFLLLITRQGKAKGKALLLSSLGETWINKRGCEISFLSVKSGNDLRLPAGTAVSNNAEGGQGHMGFLWSSHILKRRGLQFLPALMRLFLY